MNIYIKAVLIILGLWILQGILSYIQINHYRKRFSCLRKKGRVLVGQQKGKLRGGSIVMLVINDDDKIIDAEEMKGFTVFNKFKKKNEIIGKSINNMELILRSMKNQQSMKALQKALENAS